MHAWTALATLSPMNTSTGIAVALAVIIALAFMFLGPWIFTPFQSAPVQEEVALMPESGDTGDMISNDMPGTGAEAVVGSTVSVNYVGRLENGTVFDASANHGGPFSFTLGQGMVIAGWEQGILGMKEGGKRTLTIPPDLGYGASQVGPIPANSTLIFEVELVQVQ